MMCYSLSAAVDVNGYFLGSHLSSGNVHDSKNFQPLINDVLKRFSGSVKNVAADAGYIAPHISKLTTDLELNLCIPYKRPMTNREFLPRYEYAFDEYYNRIICPNNSTLEYSTTTREGKQIYKSDPLVCQNCELLKQCTHSKGHQKVIERHIWQDYHEEVIHNRHTYKNRSIYKLRAQTIERRFGDGKVKHGMRETQYRGLQKNVNYTMLLLACMNIKKMVKHLVG